jgi:hypothetical protein
VPVSRDATGELQLVGMIPLADIGLTRDAMTAFGAKQTPELLGPNHRFFTKRTLRTPRLFLSVHTEREQNTNPGV